jgi:flagellar biosynthetic protein FliR
MPARILLSLALAIIMLPLSRHAGTIDPFSFYGIVLTIEQAVIGGMLGLAFHFTMTVITLLGYLISSQISLSMAVMNDPVNGTSSDVVSTMLTVLCIIVFFAIDGHLILAGIIGASMKAWPIGSGFKWLTMQALALNFAWVFSAAMLLAIPIIFSTMVVQIGFGLLNRVAPSLNLFSLGFSIVTLFGLFMLMQIVRFIPDHYIRMTGRVLEMLQQQIGG